MALQQCTKKLMSYSPGLVDFPVSLVDLILYLPDWQVKVLGEYFFEEINLIHCTWKNFFGLVKITSGLLHSGYSLPEGLAGKLNLPCPTDIKSFFLRVEEYLTSECSE